MSLTLQPSNTRDYATDTGYSYAGSVPELNIKLEGHNRFSSFFDVIVILANVGRLHRDVRSLVKIPGTSRTFKQNRLVEPGMLNSQNIHTVTLLSRATRCLAGLHFQKGWSMFVFTV